MSTATDTAPTRRPDPRRARTRAALVQAGRELLAEGRSSASIQEITERAGVGFGSFHNHFDGKDELFVEAVESTLDMWGEMRDAVVAGIDDPAEVFAASYRMLGRVQRDLPELVRVTLNAGASVLMSDRGLRPRALADLQRGIDQGRFTVPTAELGLMLIGGALLGLMQLLDADPTLDVGEVSDVYTQHLLLGLGVDPAEAERLVRLPLPGLDTAAF